MTNTQIELASRIANNENVSDNTLLELLNKGFSDADVYMAIAAATENETIAWKIQRILEENEYEWSKSDWESVRHEMIDSLTVDWRKHEDIYYALNGMCFANTPGYSGNGYDGGFYDEDIDYDFDDDEDY